MCGLFLILQQNSKIDDSRALAATKMLHHRGPDGTGHFRFQRRFANATGGNEIHGFLGHTRLAILDPQTRSDQPFRRDGKTLIHNGEIYNFRDLRSDLRRGGITFDTDSDTEVLLQLVSQGGINALNQARGMWAFCLLDEIRGVLTAARDRHGKKPLFYFHDGSRLCIASEIAPIAHYLGLQPAMRGSELDRFLRHGWMLPGAGGPSHIENIFQIHAGAALSFDLSRWRLSESRYFSLVEEAQRGPRAPEELPELLRQAVRERLVSDRPVGLLLSGGVDSSLILSVLRAEKLEDRVRCFTGDAGKSEDASYARACIEQLGLEHVNVPLNYGEASIDSFLQVCKHQEKPFPLIGNVLAMPQLYARIAEHDVPVVLDGTGGDEVFAGYWDRQHGFAMAEAAACGDHEWLQEAILANADNPKFQAWGGADALGTALKSGRPMSAAAIVGSPLDPVDLADYVAESVRSAPSSDPLDGFVGSLGQALALDASQGRLHEWLWQNDRNAMMSGIENRSPFLDHRLLPYMHSGYRRKFVGPWNKHELRSLFPSFVSLPTQWRPLKQGFRWVYGRFLRHNRTQILELIESSQLLAQRVRVRELLDRAKSDQTYLESSLVQRMLSVAGVEQAMGLALVQ